MEIVADRVTVRGAHGPMLLPTTLWARTGDVSLVVGAPGDGHVALALVLGGQLEPSSGRVTVGGSADREVLRRRTALVDVPRVTEPEPGIPVRAVIGEELALSGQPARPKDVAAFLAEHDGTGLASERFENVPPAVRTDWLARLAALRGGVDVLVLAHPDRFGGEPTAWWDLAQQLAEGNRAVVVQCTHVSARLLGRHDYAEVGAGA